MTNLEQKPTDSELSNTLTPAYFGDLVQKAQSERARLLKALELLEPEDMGHESLTFLGEHLERMIAQWRGDAARAALRFN
jgi:hypothetical protein